MHNNKRKAHKISPDLPESKRAQSPFQMATDLVGSMTKIELFKMFEVLLESKMAEVAKKSDIEAVTTDYQKIMETNSFLTSKLTALENKYEQLEYQIEDMHKKSTENNLIVRVATLEGRDEKEHAVNICTSIIQPPLTENIQIHEIKSFNPNTKNFIVKLETKHQVIAALKSSNTLRNNGITFSKDLPASIRHKRNKLMCIKRRLNELNPEIKVLVREDKMFVNKNLFRWSSTRGFVHNNMDAIQVLNDIYQADLNQHLSSLFDVDCMSTPAEVSRQNSSAPPTSQGENSLVHTHTNTSVNK